MEKAHTGARYDTIHRHARLGACGSERVAVGITSEQMARMEHEMSLVQNRFKAIEQSYGTDVLNLVLARGYANPTEPVAISEGDCTTSGHWYLLTVGCPPDIPKLSG